MQLDPSSASRPRRHTVPVLPFGRTGTIFVRACVRTDGRCAWQSLLDAARIPEMIALLRECEDTRSLLTRSAEHHGAI